MAEFKVTRCICHARSFEEIKDYADTHNINSVEKLQQIDFCSNSCQMCAPYVKMVLETGQIAFDPGTHYKQRK